MVASDLKVSGLPLVVFGLGWALIWGSWNFCTHPRANRTIESVYILDTNSVRWARPILGGLLTSTLWVSTIFEYAENNALATAEMEGLLNATIASDPLWVYPFEFGGLALHDANGFLNVRGIALLRNGIVRFPKAWKPRVYLSIGLSELGYPADAVATPLRGLERIENAIPDYVRTLAFTVLSKGGKGREAGEAFADALRDTPDPAIEDLLTKRLARELARQSAEGMNDSVGLRNAFVLKHALRDGTMEESFLARSLIVSAWNRSKQ
jgi:hypothetical protein